MTAIEWTDRVWNPTTGCDKVSPGCDHCYAMTMAKRLKGMGSVKYQNDGDPKTSGPGFGLSIHPDTLDLPLKWRKPQRIFVNSMSDLFHDQVPDEFIAKVWAVMALAGQHTFQVLTKRHGRMKSLLNSPTFWDAVGTNVNQIYDKGRGEHPGWYWNRADFDPESNLPDNVWLGVSAENQQWADIRIPALLGTPAAVRFVSAEPLLGPIDLTNIGDARRGSIYRGPWLDWVIVGGESGPGARPMHPDWARGLRDQCQDAGVAFLFKQWGEWTPNPGHPHRDWANLSDPHAYVMRVGKHAAGRELDGRTWDEYPQAAEATTPDPHAGQLWANELQSRQRQVPSDREWS